MKRGLKYIGLLLHLGMMGIGVSSNLMAQVRVNNTVVDTIFPSIRTEKVQSMEIRKNQVNELLVKNSSLDLLSLKNRVGVLDQVSLLEVPNQGNFTTIVLEGYAFTNKIGEPRLPQKIKLIEVPQNAEIQIIYIRTKYKDLPLSKKGFSAPLYPLQPPIPKNAEKAPSFVYHSDAYSRNDFGSSTDLVKVEMLGESRGTRLAKLIISPIQYNPTTNTLRVYTILDFEVEFKNADWKSTQKRKEVYHSAAFDKVNKQSINPLYFTPSSLPAISKTSSSSASASKRHTKTIQKGNTERPKESLAVADQRPLRYVILADEMFRDSLQPFIAWKTIQGFDVVQLYTSDSMVGKTNTSIRACLKQLYDQANDLVPAPSFLLIVGDTKQIPPFNSRLMSGYNAHITDLYYGEYTDDILPDLYYGRFSANTVEELMPQIYKTISMGNINISEAAFLDTTILIAGYDKSYGDSHLNTQVNYLKNNYFNNSLGIFCWSYPFLDARTKANEIIEKISNGNSIICYTAHGNVDRWSEPTISIESLKRVNNKNKYPLMIGNCCLTGKFDKTCFGEELLRQKDKGAVVYIGGTSDTYFDEDFYWSVGYTSALTDAGSISSKSYTYNNTSLGAFDCFFHTHGEPFEQWARSVGEIEYSGNMAVVLSNSFLSDYYWEVYQIFGDPSFMPYKTKPPIVKVKHEPQISNYASSFCVQTEAFAQVAITRDSVIFGVAIADTFGVAEVHFMDYIDTIPLTLCVSNQFRAPYITTLEVIPPSDKYLQLLPTTTIGLSDQAVTKLSYGMDYDVHLLLNNVGKKTVNSFTVEFFSNSPYFRSCFTKYEGRGPIKPADTFALKDPLKFHISADIPNNTQIEYIIRVIMDNDSTNPLKKKQKFLVLSPVLSLDTFMVDDSFGLYPNGVLDNGEVVKGRLKITNVGGAPCLNPQLKIRSDKEYYLNLPQKEQHIGDIVVGETKEIVFDYSAKDTGTYYDIYTLFFDFESKTRQEKVQTKSYISPVVETFETGNFTFVNWDMKFSDWRIAEDTVYEGKYSACSAPMFDYDTSLLTIQVEVPIDDILSFYYKTSTECINMVYGDFLCFFIDGVRLGRWAGEQPWSFVSYPVKAGKHSLSWMYIKDERDKMGQDKVWLDFIRLPIGSKAPINPVANQEKTCIEEQSTLSLLTASSNEISIKFNLRAPAAGCLYLVNILGERVRLLSSNLSLPIGLSSQSFPFHELKPGMYICVWEGYTIQGNHKLPMLNTLKIVLK